jgi:hypothetical protein
MLLFLCTSGSIILYVMFSYKHVWSIIFVLLSLFLMLLSPAVCFGYQQRDDFLFNPNNNMPESSYLNLRDMGYVAAAVFYMLSYAPTTVAWVVNNSLAGAAILVAVSNMCVWFAYILWIVIFVS